MFLVIISFFKKKLIKEAGYRIKKEKLLSFFFYTHVVIFEINIFSFISLLFFLNFIIIKFILYFLFAFF